jgi:transcriptional antiterminator RfaH
MEKRSSSTTSVAIIDAAPRWYVIYTRLKQEDRAGNNLKVLGAQVFNPKIRERRYNQFSIAPAYVTKSLFPRYIFAKFKIDDLYHKVRFTRGVYNVVSFSDGPTPIAEEIITLIRSNITKDGFIRTDEELRPGDRVMVKDGPLKNFAGIFEREMKDSDRIKILLDTVSYQARIEIERDMVRRED